MSGMQTLMFEMNPNKVLLDLEDKSEEDLTKQTIKDNIGSHDGGGGVGGNTMFAKLDSTDSVCCNDVSSSSANRDSDGSRLADSNNETLEGDDEQTDDDIRSGVGRRRRRSSGKKSLLISNNTGANCNGLQQTAPATPMPTSNANNGMFFGNNLVTNGVLTKPGLRCTKLSSYNSSSCSSSLSSNCAHSATQSDGDPTSHLRLLDDQLRLRGVIYGSEEDDDHSSAPPISRNHSRNVGRLSNTVNQSNTTTTIDSKSLSTDAGNYNQFPGHTTKPITTAAAAESSTAVVASSSPSSPSLANEDKNVDIYQTSLSGVAKLCLTPRVSSHPNFPASSSPTRSTITAQSSSVKVPTSNLFNGSTNQNHYLIGNNRRTTTNTNTTNIINANTTIASQNFQQSDHSSRLCRCCSCCAVSCDSAASSSSSSSFLCHSRQQHGRRCSAIEPLCWSNLAEQLCNVGNIGYDHGGGRPTAHPWFFPNIGREEANTRLSKYAHLDGVFLVRTSHRNPDGFVLSFVHRNRVVHCQIRQLEVDQSVCFSLDAGKTKFYDVQQLIEFHQLNYGYLPTKLRYFLVN